MHRCGVNSTWTVDVSVPMSPMNTVRGTAPNTAVQLDYPADLTYRYHLSDISWSFNQQPAQGTLLSITLNPGGLVYQLEIRAIGNGQVSFAQPMRTEFGTQMTIRLAAGGAGQIGTLNANVWRYGVPEE